MSENVSVGMINRQLHNHTTYNTSVDKINANAFRIQCTIH